MRGTAPPSPQPTHPPTHTVTHPPHTPHPPPPTHTHTQLHKHTHTPTHTHTHKHMLNTHNHIHTNTCTLLMYTQSKYDSRVHTQNRKAYEPCRDDSRVHTQNRKAYEPCRDWYSNNFNKVQVLGVVGAIETIEVFISTRITTATYTPLPLLCLMECLPLNKETASVQLSHMHVHMASIHLEVLCKQGAGNCHNNALETHVHFLYRRM